MIKEIDRKDLAQALDMVNAVFSEFVAVDYSEQGRNHFAAYLENKYEETAADFSAAHKKMWGYYQDDKIIGVISTRDISHISLLFVDKQHHRKGIARQLFEFVREDISKNTGETQITVNSSTYAVKVYECLGFAKTGEQQEKDGMIFVPMSCPL